MVGLASVQEGIALTVKSFSHLAKGSSTSKDFHYVELSKAEAMLGYGKGFDFLLSILYCFFLHSLPEDVCNHHACLVYPMYMLTHFARLVAIFGIEMHETTAKAVMSYLLRNSMAMCILGRIGDFVI